MPRETMKQALERKDRVIDKLRADKERLLARLDKKVTTPKTGDVLVDDYGEILGFDVVVNTSKWESDREFTTATFIEACGHTHNTLRAENLEDMSFIKPDLLFNLIASQNKYNR
jgi:hypothetical protein